MKQLPISSFSSIFCLKSKDRVLVDINLLVKSCCKSARVTVVNIKKINIIFERKKMFCTGNWPRSDAENIPRPGKYPRATPTGMDGQQGPKKVGMKF